MEERASISPDNLGEKAGGLAESHFAGADGDVEDRLSLTPDDEELDKFKVSKAAALGNKAGGTFLQ